MTKLITALKIQSKNKNRINVFLDGQFAFGLSRFVAAWLTVGQALSEEKITELLSADEREVAYQRALRLISIRPRSSSEIKQHLNKNKVPSHLITETINRLKENGLIDDDHFAQSWVENRSTFKPRSRRALLVELYQKGISRDIIDQTLENVDDETLAYQAAEKHARKFAHLEWLDFRKKMLGFLSRRGFNYEISATVISQIWQEMDTLELSSPMMNLKR